MEFSAKLMLVWIVILALVALGESASDGQQLKLQGLNIDSDLTAKRSKRSHHLNLPTNIHIAIPFPDELLGVHIAIEPNPFNRGPDPTTLPPLISTEPVTVSVVTEPVPVVTEPVPVVTEPAPVVTELVPVVTEPVPVVTEPAPVVTEPVPVVTERAPVVTEPAPVVTEPVPVVTEPATVVTEPAPVVTEPVPVVTEPAPVVTEPSLHIKAKIEIIADVPDDTDVKLVDELTTPPDKPDPTTAQLEEDDQITPSEKPDLETTIVLQADDNSEDLETSMSDKPEPDQGIAPPADVVSSPILVKYDPADLPELLEKHIHINISADKINFYKVKSAEKIQVLKEFPVTIELTHKIELDKPETEQEKEQDEVLSESEKEPTVTEPPKKVPTTKPEPSQLVPNITPPLLDPNVTISITHSHSKREVFLQLREGKAYFIKRGATILASILYPKVVILTSSQTKEGHLNLEFFRTPDFGLNEAHWQIIVDKLGTDHETLDRRTGKQSVDESERRHHVKEHGEKEKPHEDIEEVFTNEDETLRQWEEEVMDRKWRRPGLKTYREQRSAEFPQSDLTLSALDKDYSSFPRIVSQSSRLPRTFTIGNGLHHNPPLDTNCTYGVYIRVTLQTKDTIINLQSGYTRFSNGTLFSAHVGDTPPDWYDKSMDRVREGWDTMREGWDTVNQLPNHILYGMLTVVAVLLVLILISIVRRRRARCDQVASQLSYWSNVNDAAPLLADVDEEPGPSAKEEDDWLMGPEG